MVNLTHQAKQSIHWRVEILCTTPLRHSWLLTCSSALSDSYAFPIWTSPCTRCGQYLDSSLVYGWMGGWRARGIRNPFCQCLCELYTWDRYWREFDPMYQTSEWNSPTLIYPCQRFDLRYSEGSLRLRPNLKNRLTWWIHWNLTDSRGFKLCCLLGGSTKTPLEAMLVDMNGL